MSLGNKAYEEMGKFTMSFIESAEWHETVVNLSFASEIKGDSRWPSGTNMASGTIYMHPGGKGHGKWRGILTTKDGEMVSWNGIGRSKMVGNRRKGIMLISFMTKSEKLSWMNSVICVHEVDTDMREFTGISHEWE
ncbi:MAG: hypothetical protein GKC03_09600 [Methanomassiliicoccales archaeon]|nr:hypothetical protein [Methanomassiliicoccales archaeon]NYT15447.1 hypothetical protein [Methanomassiliicoccales archaeon]